MPRLGDERNLNQDSKLNAASALLHGTSDRVIVEASPDDRVCGVWGWVGFDADEDRGGQGA